MRANSRLALELQIGAAARMLAGGAARDTPIAPLQGRTATRKKRLKRDHRPYPLPRSGSARSRRLALAPQSAATRAVALGRPLYCRPDAPSGPAVCPV